MELLGLPPEIFQQVVHELVSQLGVGEAWSYRRVCRTFAAEIYHDTFTNQPIKRNSQLSFPEVYKNNIPQILASRLKKPLDSDRDTLAFFQAMVDFACDPTGETTKTETCSNVTKLFEGLTSLIGGWRVLCELSRDKTYSRRYNATLKDPLTAPQKVIAAMAVGNSELILTTLLSLSDSSGWTCPILGSPIIAAVVLGAEAPLTTVLQWLGAPQVQSTLPKDILTSDVYDFSIMTAIMCSLYGHQSRLTRLLVDFQSQHLPPVPKQEYNHCAQLACRVKNLDAFRTILGMKFKGHVRITRETMVAAMSGGTTELIAEVLNSTDMHANKQFADTSPLVAAIRGSKVDNVRAVLDAGADINRGVTHGTSHSTPFEIMLRSQIDDGKRKDIARLLLDRGADLPNSSLWRSTKAWRRISKMLKDEQAKRKAKK